jgi:SSS family solute:Na+ symporter
MSWSRTLILSLVVLSLAANRASAQSAADASERVGLVTIDWVLIALYAVFTLCLGWYFSRRQTSTKEYFVGSGHMNPFFIGVSLFATLLSTISYLSMPGEVLGKGPAFLAIWLSFPFAYLVVAYILLPVYMRQRVTSAYELLEKKLGLSIRLLGATLFVLLRLVWMSLLLYLAAEAITVMMGLQTLEEKQAWIPWIVLVMGFVTVIYTTLGGLRAVVITDFLQTVLLYGGALMVVGTVTYHFGGFGWFPTEWQTHWDVQPVFSTNPQTRLTVVGSFFMFFVWMVCTAGGDQTSVQRFMATKDVAAARRAFAIQLGSTVLVGVTLCLVGFSLLSYFQRFPEQLPAGLNLHGQADKIFPHYIAYHLPIGISGLVVSAMMAAAMSSLDSGVNSITAVFMTDYLDRFGIRPKTERGHMRAAKVLAFTIGAIVVIGSSYMGNIPGNITAVTNKTVNLLTPIIFSLFFFALFVPFARPAGVWAGAVCGIITAVLIAFSGPILHYLAVDHGVDPATFGLVLEYHPLTGEVIDPISFQWLGPVTLVVNLAIGAAASWLVARR